MTTKTELVAELLESNPTGSRVAIALRAGCSRALVSQVARRNRFPNLAGLGHRPETGLYDRQALSLLTELYEAIAYEGVEVEPVLSRVETFLDRATE